MKTVQKIGLMACCVLFFQFGFAQLSIPDPVRFLALGDSYTIGQSVPQEESWPYQFRDLLIEKGYRVQSLKVIAKTGWRTTDLQIAVDNENIANGSYNLVSLLIGVNNQFQGVSIDKYKPEFEALLDRAIEIVRGDKSKVFVISIPDYSYTPYGELFQSSISTEINNYNRINKNICTNYQVKYFDITSISRRGLDEPELVANDGLHPSGEMYKLWVNLIGAEISGLNFPTSSELNSDREKPIIYPTIFSGSVYYQMEANLLTIMNSQGATVKSIDLKSASGTIDLSDLPAGSYIYVFYSRYNPVRRGKLIKVN